MSKRKELHDILIGVLGSQNVYFQPPSTVKIQYPCIIYKRSKMAEKYANDILYNSRQGYAVTVVDPDPDSLIPGKVGGLPLCRFDRHYTADNLNHDVYNLYY